MNKLFLIMFAVLLVLPMVIAVPPMTTIQQFTEGYEIRIPQDNILEFNKTYDFEFHVYNITTGLPKHSGVSCYFHLYNETGNHVYEAMVNTVTHDFDYGFKVDAGNFTRVAHLYYNIQCNSSTLGGFSSSIIYITQNGKEVTDAQGNLFLGILLSIMLLSFFFAYVSSKFLEKDNTFPIGLFFLVVAIILSVYVVFMGVVSSRDYLDLSISEPHAKLFTGILFGMIGISFLSLLFLVLKVVGEIRERKSAINYGENWNAKQKQYD